MNLNKNIARAMAAAMVLGTLAPFSAAFAATTYDWNNDLTFGAESWTSGTPSTAAGTEDVTITAKVDPSLTFDVNVQNDCSTGFVDVATLAYSGNVNTLDLGHMGGTTLNKKSDGVTIPYICTLVNTNATGGAVVTMTSLYGGLKSSGTADRIESVTATADAGALTPNYGVWSGATGYNHDVIPAAGAVNLDLTQSSAATVFGLINALTGAPKSVWDSSSDATAAAYHTLGVAVAVTATTPAHQDYTDTLTFVATATF